MKHTFTQCIRLLLLTIVAVFAFFTGKAQYAVSTLETGGSYAAACKDNSGNIYTTRLNTTTNLYDVVKFTGGTTPGTVIYAGLSYGATDYPWGIATNSSGDVFVINSFETNNGQIIKLRKFSSVYVKSVVQEGRLFSAITIDQYDNLLSMEYNSTSQKYDIVRYYAGAETVRDAVLYDGLPLPSSGGTSYPWGLVTDSRNNIYFTDFLESDANPGGAIMKLTYPTYSVSTLASGRDFSALAIDATDNLYTIEAVSAGQSNVVKYTDPTQTGTVLNPSGNTMTVSGVVYP